MSYALSVWLLHMLGDNRLVLYRLTKFTTRYILYRQAIITPIINYFGQLSINII